MFQDEAGFGRINKPKYCWCKKGIRPLVPCHHIREYRYAFGAVEPLTGDSFFLILPYCNTAWHKTKRLRVPKSIVLIFILPYTPEMNPIEQIWKEIRKRGFKNEIFDSLDKVIERLCETICSLSTNTVKSITGRDWIIKCFN